MAGAASSAAIPAGKNRTFQIVFAPASPGNAAGSITIASDATNSSLGIPLSGNGMAPLAITTQPVNETVTAGQTATFSVVATGFGTLTYQWKKNGAAISGATAASYTTPATATSDSGAQFSVVVTDANGSLASNTATLTVTTAAVAPAITTQPANQTVIAGQTATFSVTATGTATLSYQWKKNGTAIIGATSPVYTTPATTSSDNGAQFTVTVTNSAGNITSNAATLTVNVPPTITSQPASQTVNVGQTATFSVSATGTGTLTYQWRKNGTAISGATSASYTTPATTTSDSGAQFTVVVTNTGGSVTSSAATLTVTAVAPTITTQPASVSVVAGQTATFSVAATGTAPLAYQWRKNGTAISGATSSSYVTPATTLTDSGTQFTVVVTNSAGSATSTAATLTVTAAVPTITTQPASVSVVVGQTATFSVAATGTAPLAYQWRKNGTAISGATSASYTTPATTTSDSGAQFTVVVTNSAGSATSTAATLTVTAVAPTITTQPASVSVLAGQTATFSVAATGTAPLAYQWRKNGTAISGATSASYTTPATTTLDNGALFTVTVTNSAGSITSNAATLTVNAATYVLNASPASLSFGNVTIGSSSVLSVTLTNAGNSSVNISGLSISGAGVTASGVSTGQILTPGQTATLNVTFTPSSTATISGSVTVTSSATNSPAVITLSGTGAQAVSHSVALSWTASTSTVTGYNIYRGTLSGGPYTKLNSALVAVTSYTDSTVQSGQAYFYLATSVDSTGNESVYSNEISVIIPTP